MWQWCGFHSGTVGTVVALETVALRCVGNAAVANGESVLHVAGVSVVGVEVVVPTLICHEILAVHGSAEPFKGVVVGVGHLHMVDLCAEPTEPRRETVYLLVLLERITGKLYAHITEHSPKLSASLLPPCLVRGPPSICWSPWLLRALPQRMTPPQSPGLRLPCFLLGSEDYGLGGSTFGYEFTSALGYESRLRLLVTLDYGAGFYGKFGAIGYIYPSFEQVGALLQSLFSGEDEL